MMDHIREIALDFCYSVPSYFNDYLFISNGKAADEEFIPHFCGDIKPNMFQSGQYDCHNCGMKFYLRVRPQDGKNVVLNNGYLHFLKYIEAEINFNNSFKKLGKRNTLSTDAKEQIVTEAEKIGPVKKTLSEFDCNYFDFYHHPEVFNADAEKKLFAETILSLIKLQKLMQVNVYSPLIFYEYLLLFRLVFKDHLSELSEDFYTIYAEQKMIINDLVLYFKVPGEDYSTSFSSKKLSQDLIIRDKFKPFLLQFINSEEYDHMKEILLVM